MGKKDKKGSGTGGARFQPHFRKFKNAKFTGHPQYVYDEDGNRYKVIGITKSPETNGIKNVLLERNPEPGNSAKAYLRPKPDKVEKGVRNERLKGWKFVDSDKKKVRRIIDAHDKKKR